MHTIDTIMPSLANLRVHIAPVGFEVDRIVIPVKQTRADKVWLLVHDNSSEDKSLPYQKKLEQQFKKQKIQVQIARVDRLNLFATIKAVREIILQETGNDIYVNVGSGSKIQAIACMMACMTFKGKNNIKPFYAEAEKYAAFEGKQQSFGVKRTIPLPTYEIKTPKPELVHALKLIKENNGKISKKEMADLAVKNNLIVVNAKKENYTQARFASLDKNIIQPLEHDWKFIEVNKIGRSRWIKITQEGMNAAEFLI